MRTYPLNFAIGCFHFGLKKPYPNGMSGVDYIQELRKSLESIPNISNIEIMGEETFEDLSIEANEIFTPFDQGQNFFPPRSLFYEIYFDIYIPERLQDELWTGASSDLNTEKFQVSVRDFFIFQLHLLNSSTQETTASHPQQ